MVDLTVAPGVSISLNQRKVLDRLIKGDGDIVPRSALLKVCATPTVPALNVMLVQLRRKLEPEGWKIICHRNVGYSIVKPKEGN